MHEIAEKFENAHSLDDNKTSAADAISKVVYTAYNGEDTLSNIVIGRISSLLKEE